MSFKYRCDGERGIVRVTPVEPFSVLDVTTLLDRQIAEGAWGQGMLVDARRAVLTMAEGKRLFEYVQSLTRQHGPHGPVALVTRQAVASAQAYAIRSEQAGLLFEVFWDTDEAERWLVAHTQKQV